jgi:hypothetical protein
MVYWLDTSSLTLVRNSWSDRYDFSSLKYWIGNSFLTLSRRPACQTLSKAWLTSKNIDVQYCLSSNAWCIVWINTNSNRTHPLLWVWMLKMLFAIPHSTLRCYWALGRCPSYYIAKTTSFGKWICSFPQSRVGHTYSLGSIRKRELNHWLALPNGLSHPQTFCPMGKEIQFPKHWMQNDERGLEFRKCWVFYIIRTI